MDEYNIKLTNYCIVVLGKTEGVKEEINKISDNSPRYMEAKGLLIGVFLSAMRVNELNDYFKLNERSFLIFEMGENNFGAHLNEKLNNFLFAGLLPSSEEDVNSLLETVRVKTSGGTENTKVVPELDYSSLNVVQRQQHMDIILDKISTYGMESISKDELEFLKKYN